MTILQPKPARRRKEYNRADLESYRRLVLAMLERAIRDAAGSGLPSDLSEGERADLQAEARGWLVCEDARLYFEWLGVDVAAVRAWVLAGCPRWVTYQQRKGK